MKKMTQRQRQAIATKLKVTLAATDLFQTRGYDAVTVRDICDSAGISIGTFYHHFDSKEVIINTAYYQVDLLWEERVSNYENTYTKADIHYLFQEAAALVVEQGWELSAQSYKQLINAQHKYVLTLDRPVFEKLTRIINGCIQKNLMPPDLIPKDLVLILLRLSRGIIYDWCLHEGKYDLVKMMHDDLELVLSNFFIK